MFQCRGVEDTTATFLFSEGEKLIKEGELIEASKLYTDLLDTFEKSGELVWAGNVQNKLGIIHGLLDRQEKAMNKFKEAQLLGESTQDLSLLTDAYNNIGCNYFEREIYDSAFVYFEKSSESGKSLGDDSKLAIMELNRGAMMVEMENYDAAVVQLKSAIETSAKSNDFVKTIAPLNLGVVFLNQDYYDSANHYLQLAYSNSIKYNYIEYQAPILENLGHVCYNQEQFESACDYYDECYRLKDSLFSSKTALAIAQLEQDYALAKEKLALKESELATITWQRWAIAIGALFILGIVLGFGAYRRRVAVQQARTQAVLETREDETKRITDLLWSEIGASTKDGKLSLPGQELPEHTIPGAIAAARFLSSQQYNPYLQLGLKRAVDHLLSTLNKGKEAQVAQELEEIDIDKTERLAYYRMLENILVQVFSRTNTSTISVQMAKQKNNLVFEVTANEILDPTNKRFQSAEARVQQFKGKMKFEERDNSTTIKVDVPIA